MSAQEKAALEWRQVVFHQLQGNLSQPLSARVQLMPANILTAIQEDDRAIGIANTGQYAPRSATSAELSYIDTYFKRLPASYQNAFSKKVLSIYLVDNFAGAGMTNWLVDLDGNTYYYIVFNTAILNFSIDDWISYKENSIFDSPSSSPTVRVHSGISYKALMYGLLHEGAHVLDYERGVTPFVDPHFYKIMRHTRESTEFTQGVWQQRIIPESRYDFMHRADMNVYAEFAKKGLIPRSDLAAMFSKLTQTPFVTFYSGTSWAEDFADYMTYKYMESGLGGKVKVELIRDGMVIDCYEPLKTPSSLKRDKLVQEFIH